MRTECYTDRMVILHRPRVQLGERMDAFGRLRALIRDD
jgi:hypothetical protein